MPKERMGRSKFIMEQYIQHGKRDGWGHFFAITNRAEFSVPFHGKMTIFRFAAGFSVDKDLQRLQTGFQISNLL